MGIKKACGFGGFGVLAFAVSVVLPWAPSVGSQRVLAQQQTWTGMISDSQCGGDHGSEVDVKECTQKCIREGFKYILATDNGVHTIPIANQDFPALARYAGDTVKVSGELKSGAIVVSKIEMP
jgi:hypothetical protein